MLLNVSLPSLLNISRSCTSYQVNISAVQLTIREATPILLIDCNEKFSSNNCNNRSQLSVLKKNNRADLESRSQYHNSLKSIQMRKLQISLTDNSNSENVLMSLINDVQRKYNIDKIIFFHILCISTCIFIYKLLERDWRR